MRLFPQPRERTLFAAWLPLEAGAVLGMCYFEGAVLLVCERGVWRLRPDTYGSNFFVVEQLI